jgi:DNA-binding transcriptional LysR family regulator
METKWLEDFLCLAEKRSFSLAAQVRHVTQSALSRRIRALEEWAGVELIDRSCHPLRLTVAGQLFLEQARLLLNLTLDTRRLLRAQEPPTRGAERRTAERQERALLL